MCDARVVVENRQKREAPDEQRWHSEVRREFHGAVECRAYAAGHELDSMPWPTSCQAESRDSRAAPGYMAQCASCLCQPELWRCLRRYDVPAAGDYPSGTGIVR